MKKLTSLQIMMLMSLSVGSMQLFGKMQSTETQDAIQDAILDKQAEQVQADLAQVNPAAERKLEKSLNEIHESFISIEHKLSKVNRALENESQSSTSEEQIAIHAVELEKIQKCFHELIARCSKKHHNKHEGRIQRIKDQLMKAEQSLKMLDDKHDALGVDDKIEDRKIKVKKRKPAQARQKSESSFDKSSADKQMKKKCSKSKSNMKSDDMLQEEVVTQYIEIANPGEARGQAQAKKAQIQATAKQQAKQQAKNAGKQKAA